MKKPKPGAKPYVLAGARTFYFSATTEEGAYKAAKRLLRAAKEYDVQPTSLVLSVQWIPSDGKEPSYYSGDVTVQE